MYPESTGTTSQYPESKQPRNSEVEAVRSEIERLEMRIKMFEERLAPVLRPPSQLVEVGRDAPGPVSDLQIQRIRLSDAIGDLDALMDRVEA